MTAIGFGIIGAGIMGERMLRAALEHATDSVAIAGLWDPSPAARARLGASLPALRWFDDPAALIAASECIYIASPPASHLEHAGAALAAGRAVLCEKPLASDVPAAERFVAAHGKARAAVNFPMATSFAAERIRTWLAGGAIGAPRTLAIEVAFAAWPRTWQRAAASWLDGRAEGGFTREVVSHFLFLSHRLFGPLALVEGRAEYPAGGRSETAVAARLTAGALSVTLKGSVGTTAQDDSNTWTLTGDAGAVRIRDWAHAERLVDGAWQPDASALPQDQARPLVLRRQLAAVAAMTRGQPHPLATLAEALAVQRVVETVLAA
jgi:predicted dehydrogenase